MLPGTQVAALNALGGVGAAAATGTPGVAHGEFSDRSPIHIAPVGLNLGAILQPYMDGSPENGGFGLNLMSRYAGTGEAVKTLAPYRASAAGILNDKTILIAAVGGGLLLAVLFIRKR